MKIAFNDEEIEEFIGIINRIAQDHPILVDKYLQGKEIEVDAVCDGTDILIPGIMEHTERNGDPFRDSIRYSAQTISVKFTKEMIVEYTKRLAQALHVIGLINIQFIVMDEQVYVIEVNPRSSRIVPYISKATVFRLLTGNKSNHRRDHPRYGVMNRLLRLQIILAIKMLVMLSFENLRC